MSQTAEQKAAADKAKADKATADKAAAEETTPEMVKVKFLRSHPAFAHFAGDEAEISAELFEKHSQDGEFFEKLK